MSRQNISLINEIINNGGAVISEYFPDVPPKKYTFLKRNRLIAAFSDALIVVQAPFKSGSLNTAKIADNLKRLVFAVPWNIDTFRGVGCNKLIENGAKILTNYNQVLAYLNYSNTSITNTDKENVSDRPQNETSVLEEYKSLYKFITKAGPCSIDYIHSNFLNENIADINSKLILMELDNLITLKRKFILCKIKNT